MEINSEIESICRDILEVYKQNIKDSGHEASGELANTAKYRIAWNGKWFELSFVLQDYWKWLENGTKPHFPPIDAIERWITVKRIIPSTNNGKVPSTRQLAYMIARGISIHGTKATKLLQKSIDESDNLISQLVDAIISQMEKEIEQEEAL